MLRMFVVTLLALMVTACSTFTPKPEVIYHNPKLADETEKVLILPVTNWEGEAVDKELAGEINVHWNRIYGEGNAIPIPMSFEDVHPKMEKLYTKLISTLQDEEKIKRLHKSKNLRKFITKITEKVGEQNWAVTIVNGSKEGFENGQPLIVSVAVFDTKNVTWKWLTQVSGDKDKLGNWDAWKTLAIKSLFDKADMVKHSKQMMTRTVASDPN